MKDEKIFCGTAVGMTCGNCGQSPHTPECCIGRAEAVVVLERLATEAFNCGSDAYEREDYGEAKRLRDQSDALKLGAACIRLTRP